MLTIAHGSPSLSAKRLATFTSPVSGATTTASSASLKPCPIKWSTKVCIAVRWSTGKEKKPSIWPTCRSIVITRSAPATWIMFATSRAVMGSRGLVLRSWRE